MRSLTLVLRLILHEHPEIGALTPPGTLTTSQRNMFTGCRCEALPPKIAPSVSPASPTRLPNIGLPSSSAGFSCKAENYNERMRERPCLNSQDVQFTSTTLFADPSKPYTGPKVQAHIPLSPYSNDLLEPIDKGAIAIIDAIKLTRHHGAESTAEPATKAYQKVKVMLGIARLLFVSCR